MTSAKTLTTYCKQKLFQSDCFLDYMKHYPYFGFQLLKEDLLRLEEQESLKVQRMMFISQLAKNRFYTEEQKSFQEKSLPFIGMKGIFLQKAYYPPEYIRLFNDIDI